MNNFDNTEKKFNNKINADITVITVTKGRYELLHRAAQSVYRQDYSGGIEHLILADDCIDLISGIKDLLPENNLRCTKLISVVRNKEERGLAGATRRLVYPRLARLLNKGIQMASSEWIAFLDDDNEFELDHLQSLYDFAMQNGSQAVHSARYMLNKDGSPYLDPLFPGTENSLEAARIYELLCKRGVWIKGTNVLLDSADTHQAAFNNSTIMTEKDPVFLVDQNLWLLKRSVLIKYPIPELFSDEDIKNNTCPDDKMLKNLIINGVNIKSNKKPSVKYYLGGISNAN